MYYNVNYVLEKPVEMKDLEVLIEEVLKTKGDN